MKTLNAPIEEFIKTVKTEIAADVAAGSDKAVTVENANEFAVNDYAVLGIKGKEVSEIAKITVVSGNTITFGTLALAHKDGDPITKVLFNQRKLYGCATKTGTFVLIETKDIEVDSPQGTYFEYTGDYIYFKCTYYNEHTTEESSIDDAVAVLGGESDRYCSIEAIKKQAGLLENPYTNNADVERKRNTAESEIDSAIGHIYSLPLSEIPALIENITILLAAGYLDYQEFGSESGGVKWLGEARGLLKKIEKGTMRLLGSDKSELTRLSGGRLKGYPDTSCEDEDCDRIFSVEDEY
ncbi:DUF1320 family protein [Candidatus Parcubacteria bacterium]|nr:DUF1320 family protein [Candidatus Parcubacteria bacterium]